MSGYNFLSFAGLFFLVGVAWVFSSNRKRMNLRLIGSVFALELVFGSFVFLFPSGTKLFLLLNTFVCKLLGAATAGTKFVFGPLALSPGMTDAAGSNSLGFILAFQGFPLIVFFSALMAVFYYIGLMPWLIKKFARFFAFVFRISGAESLSAACNIFVGVESSTSIKPYLEKMTASELCVVLTAGMATVSSNIMGFYVFNLKDVFPSIAGHLISASLLSAPAAIMMAKIIVPEDKTPVTFGKSVELHYEKESHLFEAIINGANTGMKLIFGIVALLLAVLGLVELVDLFAGWAGGYLNQLSGLNIDWTLKGLAGYAFYPFTVMLGVPLEDAARVASIIGERLFLTEVTSYQDLAAALADGSIKNPRSAVIASYALCGFAHVASMSIFVGGISAIAPTRKGELSSLGFRALFAATLACLFTGCVAGVFCADQTVVLGF